jgi:two-component system sensor histidine kinase/response regulator
MNSTPSNQGNEIELLIVEDSRTQALRLRRILEKHGFRVTVAGDGKEALTAIATLRPELIISDIQMPEMDGYELCRHVKANPALNDIPIMLLTSLSEPHDIIHALECGADNFVVKPYEEDFLMERVRSVLANSLLTKKPEEGKGITIEFSGKRYLVDASRRQILNLLLSTYETAVKTNRDLIQAHEELKAAQAQLIEAEKLQSVGRLAAGVAHEVRNPLAIMEMGLAFLAEQNTSEEGNPILAEMREAVQRSNHVITSLMDITSPRELGMGETNLHEIIDRALSALEKAIVESGITVKREFASGLPSSRMDADKIEQVFVNIVSNAVHAMSQGGALIVVTKIGTLGHDDVGFVAGDRSGVRFRKGERVIMVEVSNTGEAIAPENLGKVFDPFFSTKPTGQGMGLGLTVAKKLVELHSGMIRIGNGPHGGATVTLIFKIL